MINKNRANTLTPYALYASFFYRFSLILDLFALSYELSSPSVLSQEKFL